MSRLGMYVHMHWGYGWPYSARTWSLADWHGYASGLRALGYDTVMIWPVFETVPDPPTPSDRAHLERMARVVAMLQGELGMQVGITLGPNTVGNARAADYPFAERPFFVTDERLDPGRPKQVAQLLTRRRLLFEHVGRADFFAVIDGDPGGWVGSTTAEFAELLVRHLELVREYNPRGRLCYWMWTGWEPYNRMWQEVQQGRPFSFQPTAKDFLPVLRRLLDCPADAWEVFSCWPVHQEAVEALGLQGRALYYPYGLVEGEPTFPLTNWNPGGLGEGLARYDPAATALGVMANAQTHVVQLPHTWLFAHLARGGRLAEADVEGFAEALLPGCGRVVSAAWQALGGRDSEAMRSLAGQVAGAACRPGESRYGGLLLGGEERFLADLGLQLRFRAEALDFAAAPGRSRLPRLLAAWSAWQERTGFGDAYLDTLNLHPALRALGEEAVNRVLADFDNWRQPAVRHGLVPRLLCTLRALA